MLSTNGRKKSNKIAANANVTEKTKCLNCGHIMPRMAKIFGEHLRCDKCDSTNLEIYLTK
jgi:Zn finger protein HypA/HybF involved in hydrogenase expression